jgi:PcrA/UvrD helicase-like protein
MAKFTVGDRVTHDVYGHGTIASTDEYHTRISFDEHGVRTFVASLVVLTRSTAPPPVRATTPRRKS